MKLRCPACHAEAPVEAYLGADAARTMIVAALRMPSALANPLVQYLGMFRAPKRALAFDRVEKLLHELQPMIEQAHVNRGGIDRVAPLALWQAALEQMCDLRAAGKLTLPLKSHGYLLEIVAGMAEKASAQAEAARENTLRQGRRPTDPVDVQAASHRARMDSVGRVGSDLMLGLIDVAKAAALLADIGLSKAAAEKLIEQHRRET